jgi:hypothetical protein
MVFRPTRPSAKILFSDHRVRRSMAVADVQPDVFGTYFCLYGECKALSNQIVLAAASIGMQITVDSLMQPPSVGNSCPATQQMLQTTEGQIQFLQHKKNSLAKTLQAYQNNVRDGHPTAAPAQQHPTSAAPQQRPAASQQPASTVSLCPPLPDELAATRKRKTRSHPSTDPQVFWETCFGLIAESRRPMKSAELVKSYDALRKTQGATTEGHKHWLRNNTHLLFVLYKAAGVTVHAKLPRDKWALQTLNAEWRKHGQQVLEELKSWFRALTDPNNPQQLMHAVDDAETTDAGAGPSVVAHSGHSGAESRHRPALSV